MFSRSWKNLNKHLKKEIALNTFVKSNDIDRIASLKQNLTVPPQSHEAILDMTQQLHILYNQESR